jgi:hypothetical protein
VSGAAGRSFPAHPRPANTGQVGWPSRIIMQAAASARSPTSCLASFCPPAEDEEAAAAEEEPPAPPPPPLLLALLPVVHMLMISG